MCGIAGVWSTRPSESLQVANRVRNAMQRIAHRGPDAQDSCEIPTRSGTLTLAHTRLSIIDLSPAGKQPFKLEGNRYTIVFNGEIYNYKELRAELMALGLTFRTATDTEVLMQAWAHWGHQCLSRLVGMFAFVLHDAVEEKLFFARDAFGIKPLFISESDGQFSFASELPAVVELMADHPTPDAQSAYDYLAFGAYDRTERTFFSNVRQLQPGHWQALNLVSGEVSPAHRWWWPAIDARTDLSFESAADQLRELFLSSVRLHLRSDVPLGAALSGGLDSSAVVCAIRHLEPDMAIHTFSYIAQGSKFDEEPWVDLVNSTVKAIPHKIFVTAKELEDDLGDMVSTQGEPFGGTSIYAQYRVFKSAREHGIIVTLDGQGADELLAGYDGYPGPRLHSLLETGQWGQARLFAGLWSAWPGRTHKAAWLALGAQLVPPILRNTALRLVGRNPTPAWLDSAQLAAQGVRQKQSSPTRHADARGRRLASALRDALTGTGLAALLRHADRNAMRWGVESRVPFLTPQLAEFLLRLPEHYLISPSGQTKHVFRHAMRGIVPDAILDRRDKIGFATPEHQLLGQISGQQQPARYPSFIRPQAYASALENGATDTGSKRWRLLNFQIWATQFASAS